jgi:ribosomal protein S18 acetylase RimI-like enzyme
MNLHAHSPCSPVPAAPRRATAADIPALLDLADALVEYDRQFDPSLSLGYNRSPEGMAWLEETLADPDALVLVADNADHAADSADAGTRGGALRGMLFGRIEAAEPWRQTGGPLGELEMFCVAPTGRGQGVGKALVTAFSAWARGRGAVRLWGRVSAANTRAIAFYQRELFQNYDVILERVL